VISVQTSDFNLAQEYEDLRDRAGDPGAVVTFTGLVREFYHAEAGAEPAVTSLFLEHYPGMTEKALQDIAARAQQRWPLLAVRIIHRVGELRPKDQIVFVGAASAHRGAAFAAAEFMMDYLKSEAPFWKKQKSADQETWIDSRASDSSALERWKT
jgi:molybdopterin synthase catalytic subunit